MKHSQFLASAILLATLQIQAKEGAAAASSPVKAVKADPLGKCFGVIGKGQGDCGGKNPVTGDSWGCSGQNPTADLGYKEMRESECRTAALHKDATKKSFEPYKVK